MIQTEFDPSTQIFEYLQNYWNSCFFSSLDSTLFESGSIVAAETN